MGNYFTSFLSPPDFQGGTLKSIAPFFTKMSRDAYDREAILVAIPYVDADREMSGAISLYEERLSDIDLDISRELVKSISLFYITYARLLTRGGQQGVMMRLLMDTRRGIIDKLEELKLKVARVQSEPAYDVIVFKMKSSLTSCTSALWHKHGYREAIEMYYPRAH